MPLNFEAIVLGPMLALVLVFILELTYTFGLELLGLLLVDIGHDTTDLVAPFRFMSFVFIEALLRRFRKLVNHSDKLVNHFA